MNTRTSLLVLLLLASTTPALADGEASAPPIPVERDEEAARRWNAHLARLKPRTRGWPRDLTGLVAHLLPADARAPGLLGLDLLVPVVLSAPAGVAGAVVGGAAAVAMANSAVAPVTTVLAGAMLGSLVLGAVALLGLDLMMSTTHLSLVAPARVAGLLAMAAPVTLVAIGSLLLIPLLVGVPGPLVALIGGGVLLAAVVSVAVGIPAALAVSLLMRLASDTTAGNPMWVGPAR